MIDMERSREIAALVNAKKRECWSNARLGLVILASPKYGRGGSVHYVEGYSSSEIAPQLRLPHGWLEEDGTIVDPSPSYHNGRHHTYHPVARFTLSEIRELELEYYEEHEDDWRDEDEPEPSLPFPVTDLYPHHHGPGPGREETLHYLALAATMCSMAERFRADGREEDAFEADEFATDLRAVAHRRSTDDA